MYRLAVEVKASSGVWLVVAALAGAAVALRRASVPERARALRPEGGVARGLPSGEAFAPRVTPRVTPRVDAGVARLSPRPRQFEPLRRVQARPRGLCRALLAGDGEGHLLALADLSPPPGVWSARDAYAVVSRAAGESLGTSAAPDDLVDVTTLEPVEAGRCEPPARQCLRREAAVALRAMLDAMRAEGVDGAVHSAFRDHTTQCAVFQRWAHDPAQGFCRATVGSALPGHSQHQLGTAVDLFTAAWNAAGPSLRAGFGCSPGGRWIAAHAHAYGFVLPYPAPLRGDSDAPCAVSTEPDGRTGYEYEPWHLRYVGPEVLGAWLRERRRGEVFDSWLRRARGLDDDAGLPVCDGCQCGFCSTFAAEGERGPCAEGALRLDVEGRAIGAVEAPSVERLRREGERWQLRVRVPRGTLTAAPAWREGYDELSGFDDAWRLVFRDASGRPRRALALIEGAAPGWVNGAPRRLPTRPGVVSLSLTIPESDARWRVSVERLVERPARDGAARDTLAGDDASRPAH